MAELLIAHHDLQLAQTQVDWLLQNRPDDPQAHLVAAYLLASGGDISAAIAEIQKAITLAPSDGDLHLQLALLLLKKGQPDEAEANLRKAVELNPKAVGAWLLMGTFYQALVRTEKLSRNFATPLNLIRKIPNRVPTLFAFFWFRAGRPKQKIFSSRSSATFRTTRRTTACWVTSTAPPGTWTSHGRIRHLLPGTS